MQEKIAKEIIEMSERDQEAIRKYGAGDERCWKVIEENTKRATEIINEYGLISIPEYGEKASHRIWLLVQHFPDSSINIMEKYLKLMEGNMDKINKRNYAYLYDRIQSKKNLSQRYGTQIDLKSKNNIRKFKPIEDIKNVDKLRAEMGLEDLIWYKNLLEEGEDYKVELPEGYKPSSK